MNKIEIDILKEISALQYSLWYNIWRQESYKILVEDILSWNPSLEKNELIEIIKSYEERIAELNERIYDLRKQIN